MNKKVLNERAEKIVSLKKDFKLVSESTRELMEENLKKLVGNHTNILEMVRNDTVSEKELKDELLKIGIFAKTTSELMEDLRIDIVTALEKKGVQYFITESNSSEIKIIKKIGIGKTFAESYFDFNGGYNASFVNSFARFRLPNVVERMINHFKSKYEEYTFSKSKPYDSDVLTKVNVDFVMSISSKQLRTKKAKEQAILDIIAVWSQLDEVYSNAIGIF